LSADPDSVGLTENVDVRPLNIGTKAS
jgi:hypothetical protein